MIEYNITPLFSIPLLSANIGPLDPISLAWVKNLEYPKNSSGRDRRDENLLDSERGFDIINAPQLKNLKQNIKAAVDYYTYELLDVDPAVEFEFSTSWINRIEPGEKIDLHDHANAIISGVYYIEVNNNSAPITFVKNKQHLNLFPASAKPLTTGKNWNQYNSDSITLQPQNGNILIFPSHLEHRVEQSSDTNYRYGLAFNLYCKGTLGNHSIRVDL
jgi:uncharacterized protein (TIGR02466 family)